MQSATKAAIAAILVRCSGIDYQAIRSGGAQLLSPRAKIVIVLLLVIVLDRRR
jgi:hypothetical protein